MFRLMLFLLLVLGSVAFADSVCVRKEQTPLLQKPDKNSVWVKNLRKYTPLKMTGKRSGVFVEVEDMDGHTAWVTRKDVSQSLKCVSVTEKIKLRRGPGTKYSVVSTAHRGRVFLDRGGEDGWTEVEDENGRRAWLKLENIWRPRETQRISFEN